MHSFSRKDQRPLHRRWEFLLLLLALLLSFVCVFSATWLALNNQPEDLTSANMLPVSQADYGRLSSESTPFAPLNPGVGAEAATDVARLASTYAAFSDTPIPIVLLPSTPTSTPSPTRTPAPIPTALPVATSTPIPVVSPTSISPGLPSPTATTAVNPTPTSTTIATVTAIGTATETPTAISPATPTPTATLPGTSTPTATSTPVPPTPIPTDTPAPTATPVVPFPIVESIVPNTGVNTGTVTVTITGQNFQPGCTASLGSVSLVGVSCPSTTTVLASVPPDIIAGYYDLTITNPDNRSGPLTNAYTATNPVPAVATITLNTWFTTTDRVVTITGDNFRNTGAPGNLRGALDGTPLTGVTYISPTTLAATVPSRSALMSLGVYTLTVTNPGPTNPTGRLADAFTIMPDTDPVPPANLRAAAGDRKVVLGWDPNTEIDLAGYRVYRTDTGLLTTTTRISYLDLAVTNGITYSYYVRTTDLAGHESLSSTIVSAQPYDITPYTYTANIACTPGPDVTNCNDAARPPDGFAAAITGTGAITLDFGVNRGIIDGPGPDMVIFEWWNPNAGGLGVPGILLDFVTVEISDGVSGWYTVFDWDGSPGGVAGTNIDSFAADGEGDGEFIPETVPLYEDNGQRSGISIDIGIAQPLLPPGYSFHLVRLRYPGGGVNPGGNIDAVRRLN
jgi:hypothetical protein